ncbi:oligoribonuclease [Pullulanibacillus camelliae]|uniref:Oligoribonuclease n=1 Tax=Pullulanibacillus camelliae TaxID=1707096 RepID=A0A8J2YLG9_9BACL|nr:bifunctional oligoribonuclease/PAP phosphatase NrnA [Pullulanibacillus camelliae]GGE52082.1 oligoribonuclease [Pullulanibacillus camelliae]
MLKKILDAIASYNTIIIHRHVRPDPDALGSQGGLATLIKDNFPDKQVFVVGEEVDSLKFLSVMDSIDEAMYRGALVIVCDTANQARVSDERYTKGDMLIKIDHHPNEDPYGDLMWVDPSASSVSEMIVKFYQEFPQLTLSDQAARLLYAGIVGDTGRFLFNNTTPATFECASLLVQQSFDRQALLEQLNEMPEHLLRFKGYVLEHFELVEGMVGQMRLTQKLLADYKVTPQEGSLLINSFSELEGIKAWVFFVEEPDQIRVRLRSKGPVVNKLAGKYGGGGHPMASGATVYNWEDCDKLLAQLVDLARQYKDAQ